MARRHQTTRPHHRRRSSNQHSSPGRSGPFCAPDCLRPGLIITLAALCALSCAHASSGHPGRPQGHPGSASTWHAVPLGGLRVIGLRDAIPIDSEHSGQQVAQLWQQFQSQQLLHHVVDWSTPTDIYALYTGFDLDSTVITLTIGYLEKDLLRPPNDGRWVRQLIPDGKYVNLSTAATTGSPNTPAATTQTSVRRGWQELTHNALPAAIVERYHMTTDGTINKGEILVLYR